MRSIRLESFNNLEDAIMWIEHELYELELEYSDLKGEIEFIDGRWRVSVVTNSRQLEMKV